MRAANPKFGKGAACGGDKAAPVTRSNDWEGLVGTLGVGGPAARRKNKELSALQQQLQSTTDDAMRQTLQALVAAKEAELVALISGGRR